MKKTLTIMTLGLLSTAAMAAPLTPEEALQRLQQNGEDVPATRGMQNDANLIMTWKSLDGNPAIYLFNNNDNKGFMLLSADDVIAPVLGFSDSGCFDPDNIPPAMENWLDQYAEQIEYSTKASAGLSSQTSTRATLPSSWKPIGPLVKTQWDQGTPYNNDCPLDKTKQRSVTGCVATAMSQVMNYFKYPTKGQNSISYTTSQVSGALSLDFSTLTFDWANMINNYNGSYTDAQASAVATLMMAAGYSVQMSYSSNESGAISGYIPGALVKYFNYDQSVTYLARSLKNYTEWATLIYNNLQNVGPVIYDGTTSDNGGHSFVCDGYNGNGYFHFNWGWGGVADGYFLLDALNPSTIGTGGYFGGFNFDQDVVLNIQPAKAGSKPVDQIYLSGSLQGYKSSSYIYLQINGSQYPGFRYSGTSEMTFDVGAKFEPVNNPNAAFYQACSNNSTFRKAFMPLDPGHLFVTNPSLGYPYPSFVATGVNLENNTKYKVTIAYRPDGGDWTEVPTGNGNYNYFYITKSGSNYSFENFAQDQFTCDQLDLTSALYDGNAATFQIKLTNNTQSELTRGATLLLLDSNGQTLFEGDSFVQTLDPGQSYSLAWTTPLTKAQGTGNITRPTDMYPALLDIDTEVLYYLAKTPVTMQKDPGNPTCSYKMTLDNATEEIVEIDNKRYKQYVFDSATNMQVTTTVTVTKGYFSWPLTLYVMQSYGANQLQVLFSYPFDIVILQKGESNNFTTTLNYPTLNVGGQYYLGAEVNNNNQLVTQELFTVRSNQPTGIESLPIDPSDMKFVYDKAGGRLMVMGEAHTIDVFSMSGVKLATSTEGYIDTTSLGKGVVIATATSSNGQRISTKIAL
ncbi:MAG: C10 family peptidase [Muribaculaceae bacterium]|nr:C10 family peptidase [Muribaculaceae bacterium]